MSYVNKGVCVCVCVCVCVNKCVFSNDIIETFWASVSGLCYMNIIFHRI